MNPFMHNCFNSYFEKKPISLVDVGASGGIKDAWKKIEKHLHVIGFEPDEKAYNELLKLKKGNETFLNTALYNRKDELYFYLTRKQELASIFYPDFDILKDFPDASRFDVLKKVKVKTDTLDSILEANSIKDIDAIKIDTQGSGLCILEGAQKSLEDVFCVEIEAEFLPIYQSQQLFAEIDIFMREKGFNLFDLRPWYWKRKKGSAYGMPRGQIIFADCLYLKNPQSIEFALEEQSTDKDKKSKVLRMLTLCNLFGYVDYAIDIFDKNSYLFSKHESNAFKEFIDSRILWRTSNSSCLGNLDYINET